MFWLNAATVLNQQLAAICPGDSDLPFRSATLAVTLDAARYLQDLEEPIVHFEKTYNQAYRSISRSLSSPSEMQKQLDYLRHLSSSHKGAMTESMSAWNQVDRSHQSGQQRREVGWGWW